LVKTQQKIVFSEEMERNMEKVKKSINSFGLKEFVNKDLLDPSTYMLLKNGKLMRPALVFSGAELINKRMEVYVNIAIAIELLHISSLIHDDIIDQDVKRRGIKSTHVKYGNGAAIIGGDALISQAIQKSCDYGTEVISVIAKTTMDMCAGEILDYNYQRRKKVPKIDKYIEIASLKTASLISTALSIAAIYNKDDGIDKLRSFGKNIGIGFQIHDDIADAMLCKDKFGQNNGDFDRFRPNIVKTFMTYKKYSKEKAIDQAKILGRKYISNAEKEIKDFKGNIKLLEYTESIFSNFK
jgi:geranylgeranyl pyrophosphate synthase